MKRREYFLYAKKIKITREDWYKYNKKNSVDNQYSTNISCNAIFMWLEKQHARILTTENQSQEANIAS